MRQMHRAFCATPRGNGERTLLFYDFFGGFNDRDAMRRGILFVPVTLNPVKDNRPFQVDEEDNNRACRHVRLSNRAASCG